MFSDKNFATSSSHIDKRGKRKDKNAVNPLRHYYKIDQQKLQSHSDSEEEKDLQKKKKKDEVESESEEDEEGESESSDAEEELDDVSTASSDSDDVYSDEEEEEQIPEIQQETHRLAIVNMDWSQVRAVDLYVVLSSFLPKGGQLLSVTVYPSEFGLKRMEEEAVKGPVGLFDSDDEKSDDGDNGEIDKEKLRAYELSRLRYYHAVAECDSSATADHIYKACDGLEFERSSNVLDLRFVPDTMQFERSPRDVATEVPENYNVVDFKTQALQQSNIRLTWDEDEPNRKALRRNFTDKQVGQLISSFGFKLDELDINNFIATDESGSDDDDDDNDDNNEHDVAGEGQSGENLGKLEKYRALIQAGDGSDGDGSEDDKDMEVTFNTGLEDISKHILEKKKDKKSETVWEAVLRKRKEKKIARKNRYLSDDESDDGELESPEQPDDFFVEEPSVKKGKVGKSSLRKKEEEDMDKEQEASTAELELLLADDQGAAPTMRGYKLKRKMRKEMVKKKKKGKGKEDPAEDKLPSVACDDPRFSALFSSPLFALDPTDAQYKRSAAYARQLAQQKGVGEEILDKEQKKTPKEILLQSDDTSKRDEQKQSDSMSREKVNPELSSMIRSLKRKTQQYQATASGTASKKAVSIQSNGLLPKLSSSKKKAKVSKS
ncbi:hypothetical protein IFM89_001905 [Coptis chinensis]|uniref:NUC153 domain-containing protein n=1 Tax=Coptis chinensis TaxID=261450 RepID=A0A835M994_9MAGN|nr:hypothetical protein IFM89_001905 [Coptis chinensis]